MEKKLRLTTEKIRKVWRILAPIPMFYFYFILFFIIALFFFLLVLDQCLVIRMKRATFRRVCKLFIIVPYIIMYNVHIGL